MGSSSVSRIEIMKLIGSLLVASAYGAVVPRAGIWGKKSPAYPRTGSGKYSSFASVVDDVMSGGFRSPHPKPEHKPESDHGHDHEMDRPRIGRPDRPWGSGSGRRSGSAHRSGSPDSGRRSGSGHKSGKGCNNCGGTVNSNYAPVNTNVQNFVNIETEIETNINVQGGGRGGHGGQNFQPGPRPDHDDKDNHEEDADAEWGWPIWDGEGDNENAEENADWGFPVWDGEDDHDWESDISMDHLLQIVRGKLGLNTPSDMMARLDKEEIKGLLVNFLHTLKGDKDFDHEHADHHEDHESDEHESDDHTNKPETDQPMTGDTTTVPAKTTVPIDNETGTTKAPKPKSPVDNES